MLEIGIDDVVCLAAGKCSSAVAMATAVQRNLSCNNLDRGRVYKKHLQETQHSVKLPSRSKFKYTIQEYP
jgi:hypothetical protein